MDRSRASTRLCSAEWTTASNSASDSSGSSTSVNDACTHRTAMQDQRDVFVVTERTGALAAGVAAWEINGTATGVVCIRRTAYHSTTTARGFVTESALAASQCFCCFWKRNADDDPGTTALAAVGPNGHAPTVDGYENCSVGTQAKAHVGV